MNRKPKKLLLRFGLNNKKNMIDPTIALTSAIENSTKVANTPLFSTVIDRLLGFKISEWNAQG